MSDWTAERCLQRYAKKDASRRARGHRPKLEWERRCVTRGFLNFLMCMKCGAERNNGMPVRDPASALASQTQWGEQPMVGKRTPTADPLTTQTTAVVRTVPSATSFSETPSNAIGGLPMTQMIAPTQPYPQGRSQQDGPSNAMERPPRIVNLEARVKEADVAQNALASAETYWVEESILRSVREVTAATVARTEQAEPLILRAGEAQEKIAVLVGQAAKLQEANENCVAQTRQRRTHGRSS